MSYNYQYYRGSSPFFSSGFTPAVKYLIIINCVIYAAQHFFDSRFIMIFGLVPVFVFQKLWLWQAVSYMFLHGGFFHIFLNMFMLWMFGRSIEQQWGTAEFLKYYFITGIGAGMLAVLAGPSSVIPSIGASGAIYGLLVAFAMIYPDAVIYLYFFFPMKAKHLVMLFAAVEFLASFSHNTGVANVAHFGGMLIGFVYLRYGWAVRIKTKSFFRNMVHRRTSGPRKNSGIDANDLAERVNSILEKILVKGADSLTKEEREIMDKYSKLKNSGSSTYH